MIAAAHLGPRGAGLHGVLEQLGIGSARRCLLGVGARRAVSWNFLAAAGPAVSSTAASALAARVEYFVVEPGPRS